jgi:hypothetical protein
MSEPLPKELQTIIIHKRIYAWDLFYFIRKETLTFAKVESLKQMHDRLISLCLVSKFWNSVVNQNHIWKEVYERCFPMTKIKRLDWGKTTRERLGINKIRRGIRKHDPKRKSLEFMCNMQIN